MTIRVLSIEDLHINRANDRHGELENETAAIAWLFNNHEAHMRNLAKDIAAEGQLYEIPLVWPDDESLKFIVFDGNRRVTCLKLLHHPERAPNEALQKFFRELQQGAAHQLPTKIRCEVERDRDRIDAVLYRRHTGSQSGVGQSTWTDRMKSTFVNRTGKGSGINPADEIERELLSSGTLPTKKKIPRSTLNRLCSSEAFRNRLGFSLKGGKFKFTHSPEVSLRALERVADDLAEQRVVLGDLWDVHGKTKYLNQLEKEGFLPTAHDALDEPSTESRISVKKTPKRSQPRRPSSRLHLIIEDDNSVVWSADIQRIRSIWEELQFHLELKVHPNAVSVLLRVLIELSVRSYASKHSDCNVQQNDKLANVIQKVATHLEIRGEIDASYRNAIKALSNSDKIMSTSMMHQYVHSDSVSPSPEHLVSLWDTVRKLVVLSLTR